MSNPAYDTLSKVASEFEAEVVASIEEGRQEAAEVLESERKETLDLVSKTLEVGTRQAESLRRQIIGAAELEVRNSQLKSVENVVSDVFDSAMRKVSQSTGSANRRAISGLIREGMQVIGTRATVSCSSRDRKVVAAEVKKLNAGGAKLTLAEKDIEASGGVVLASPDGSVRFDNTFEARLERTKPILRKEAAAILTSD